MRSPVGENTMHAIIGTSFSWRWYGFGVTCWLMSHGLLRPEEGARLTNRDVWFADDDAFAIVRLGAAKTSKLPRDVNM